MQFLNREKNTVLSVSSGLHNLLLTINLLLVFDSLDLTLFILRICIRKNLAYKQ